MPAPVITDGCWVTLRNGWVVGPLSLANSGEMWTTYNPTASSCPTISWTLEGRVHGETCLDIVDVIQ